MDIGLKLTIEGAYVFYKFIGGGCKLSNFDKRLQSNVSFYEGWETYSLSICYMAVVTDGEYQSRL